MKKSVNVEKVSRFLSAYTKSISIFAQCIISLTVGILLFVNRDFVLNQVSNLLVIYFAISSIILLFEVLSTKIKKEKADKIIKLTVFVLIIIALTFNFHITGLIFQIILIFWVSVICISNFISFLQYRKEKTSAPFRYLLTAIINLFFAFYFGFDAVAVADVVAVYLIISSFASFLDGLSSAIPNPKKNRLKSKIRITPPTLITAFIPLRLLNDVNAFFKTSKVEEQDLSVKRSDEKPNVEVFVHVADRISGISGHVDLAINDTVYCYGIYDTDSLKFGGSMGHGVLYTVEGKDKYIDFCKLKNDEMLVGFGLVLSDEEIEKMKKGYEKITKHAYKWHCKLERAKSDEEKEKIDDYASLLYKNTNAQFYKFRKGSYKYYWALGTNCVKFADDILRASGINTIVTGIIAPGTYYYFLNNEFSNGNPMIVSRNMYIKSNKE